MQKNEINKTRYYYQYFKNVYDHSTFLELQKEIISMQRWTKYYIVLVLAIVIQYVDITSTFHSTITWLLYIKIGLLIMGVGGLIWIVRKEYMDCIQGYFPHSKRAKKYYLYWMGARYELFKKNVHQEILIDYDKLYELLQDEIKESRTTIWDNKLFAAGISFLLIGWTAISKMLADGAPIQHQLGMTPKY